MSELMSILFASGNESKLNELTIHRTTASLPFAGRYRLIDFTLSNLVNGLSWVPSVTKIIKRSTPHIWHWDIVLTYFPIEQ